MNVLDNVSPIRDPDCLGEILSKRSGNQRHYQMRDGSILCQATYKTTEYQDGDGEWHDVDERLIDDGGGCFSTSTAPHRISTYPDNRFLIEWLDGFGSATEYHLMSAGGESLPQPEVFLSDDRRQVTWHYGDFRLMLDSTHFGARRYIDLLTPSAPRRFVSHIVTSGDPDNPRFVANSLGWDSRKDKARLKYEAIERAKTNPWDTTRSWDYREEWTGEVWRIKDKKTRVRSWQSDDIAYPVRIDPTFTGNEGANSDHARTQSRAGSFYSGSTGGPVGYAGWATAISATPDTRRNYRTGVRFPNVTIPPTANITSGTLKLFELNYFSNKPNVYGAVDINGGGTWSASQRINDQVTGFAPAGSVTPPSSSGWMSLNCTSAVQNVINSQTWWSSGAAMRFMLRATNTQTSVSQTTRTSTYWKAAAIEGLARTATTNDPILEIVYTIPAASDVLPQGLHKIEHGIVASPHAGLQPIELGV